MRGLHARGPELAMTQRLFSALAAAFAAALVCYGARANPHPLPYSYPYQTVAEAKIDVEQIADLVPVRVARDSPDAARDAVTRFRSQLQTKLELGISDRLELGLYFAFRQSATADTPALRFEGLKQRLRYRFAEEGDLPLDLGVYVAVSELYNEVELEEKLLLSRRFGYLTAGANFSVQQQYHFEDQEWQFVYNPTAGAVYEFSPQLMLGFEYWARGTFDDVRLASLNEQDEQDERDERRDAPSSARHYLGPTFLLQSGIAWWTAGLYARLDHLTDSASAGDPYGKLWIRTMVGMGF